MNENDVFTEEESEIYSRFDLQEVADYGNGMFLKLRDCNINANTDIEFGQDVANSWNIYTHYVKFYDLIQFTSLKNQFSSNILDVQLYSLCSNDIKALSEALMQNKNVTTFNLTGNELETAGCYYLSDLLKKNHVIKHLELSRCKINSVGVFEFSKILKKAVLKSLNLSYNKIECAGLQCLFEALQTNTYLEVLNLSSNGIRNECVEDISTFLEMNEKLEELNLSDNFLNDETGLKILIRPLELFNKTLQVLILQWNGLSGEVCANIFKNLMIKTEGLKILDLSWNNFRHVGKILGQGLKYTELDYLDISNNPLTNDDIVELLNCIVQPNSLKSLGITHIIVDEQLEKAIINSQLRVPNFDVKVGIHSNIKTNPVDLQALYLQRIHFLGVTKPKKKNSKIDIGHTLLKMKNEGNLEPMKKVTFLSTFTKLSIKDGEEVIEELAKVFKNASKKVDVALMLDTYLKLYPETILQ